MSIGPSIYVYSVYGALSSEGAECDTDSSREYGGGVGFGSYFGSRSGARSAYGDADTGCWSCRFGAAVGEVGVPAPCSEVVFEIFYVVIVETDFLV